MGIYEILRRSAEKKDASEYIAVLDEDYEFYRHQTGTTMNKEKISIMLDRMMSNPEVVISQPRCIYENEEILVEHSLMDFPDGSREAVMAVHTIQDGKIIRTETGATLLQ
ncbi:MAG: hypothetical protein CMB78_05050 [Euryarchaeota archaeon]|nr:hypothetical protein [Euryarchaeota archaeon]|tara:strand:+ start:174 stop:503 length:330 start_codon:yes stop_codon:yes gene_type:complete